MQLPKRSALLHEMLEHVDGHDDVEGPTDQFGDAERLERHVGQPQRPSHVTIPRDQDAVDVDSQDLRLREGSRQIEAVVSRPTPGVQDRAGSRIEMDKCASQISVMQVMSWSGDTQHAECRSMSQTNVAANQPLFTEAHHTLH